MKNDWENDTCFYLGFVYVHSTFLANKGIFMCSKDKVTAALTANTAQNNFLEWFLSPKVWYFNFFKHTQLGN